MTHKQWREEYNALVVEPWNDVKKKLHIWLEKIVLVPELADRHQLALELLVDHWRYWIGSAFVVRLIGATLLHH